MSWLHFHCVEICTTMFHPQLRPISATRFVCKQNIVFNRYLNNDALLWPINFIFSFYWMLKNVIYLNNVTQILHIFEQHFLSPIKYTLWTCQFFKNPFHFELYHLRLAGNVKDIKSQILKISLLCLYRNKCILNATKKIWRCKSCLLCVHQSFVVLQNRRNSRSLLAKW